MDYVSTDYANGGRTKCHELLAVVLGRNRIVVHPAPNVTPTLIFKLDGRVWMMSVYYVEGLVKWAKYALVLESHVDKYVYEYTDEDQRMNVARYIASGKMSTTPVLQWAMP